MKKLLTTKDLIDVLNEDLKNEYKHMLFYLHHASVVEGLHRFEVREFLLEEAASEMKHVDEFAQVICGLGGIPTTECNDFPKNLTNPVDILSYALEMESEVVRNYSMRMRQTDEASDPEANCVLSISDASYVHVFMEDNVKDSRKTVDELRKILNAYRK